MTWRAPPIPAFLLPPPLASAPPLHTVSASGHRCVPWTRLHTLVSSTCWFPAPPPQPLGRGLSRGEAPPPVASSRQAACFFVFAPSDFISVQGVIFVSFFLKWTSPTRDWGHTAVREVALLWWGSVFWGRPPHWHPDRQSGGRRGGCDSCPRPVRRRRWGGGPSPGVQGGFGRREGDPPAEGTTPEKGVSLP